MMQGTFMRLVRKVFQGDRRRASRYFVELPESVVSGHGVGAVTIHDLSLTGALIEGEDLPKAGSPVTLTRESLEVAAVVAWREGTHAGLQFDHPLQVEQLFTIVHRAQFQRGEGVPAALAA